MTRRAALGCFLLGFALRDALRILTEAALGPPRQGPVVPVASPAPRYPNGLRLGRWPDSEAGLASAETWQ